MTGLNFDRFIRFKRLSLTNNEGKGIGLYKYSLFTFLRFECFYYFSPKNIMIKYFLIVCWSGLSLIGFSQSIEGIWETYDDDSGELKSETKLFIKNGKLYGKIIELHNLDIPLKDAKCYDCTDYRKNKPVMGMEIISGLKQDGKYWKGDKVLLDPNNG